MKKPYLLIFAFILAWALDTCLGLGGGGTASADFGVTFAVITILSALAKAYMENQAAQEESRIAKKNAELYEREAHEQQRANAMEADQHRKRARAFLSSQEATMAKSGVNLLSPSFREVSLDTRREFEKDAEIIRQRGLAEYRRLSGQAAASRLESRVRRNVGTYRAGSTILTGVAGAYGGYSGYSGGTNVMANRGARAGGDVAVSAGTSGGTG